MDTALLILHIQKDFVGEKARMPVLEHQIIPMIEGINQHIEEEKFTEYKVRDLLRDKKIKADKQKNNRVGYPIQKEALDEFIYRFKITKDELFYIINERDEEIQQLKARIAELETINNGKDSNV